jgi:hypothetical protein
MVNNRTGTKNIKREVSEAKREVRARRREKKRDG